tara:strand:- start:444 stop:2282 length:1839 start_codon:yes stop_codon:yes gene_type:complete
MYSLSGFKNTRNILIISLISLILISFFFSFKFFQKADLNFSINKWVKSCEILNNDNYPGYPLSFQVCKDLNVYKTSNNYENSVNQSSIYVLPFDLDNTSYFKDFFELNTLNFFIKKKRDELAKNKKLYENSERMVSIWEESLNKDFKLLDDYQQSFFVIKRFKIKHESLLNIYSSIYINIFDNNKYIFHFIIFINLLILLFLSFIFYKIIKMLFPLLSKILLILTISNIVVLPYFWIYFLSLYKEPFILLSLTAIVFNYLYLLTNKINLPKFIFCTFYLIFAFTLIRYVKYEYFIIYICSFILSILMLTLYKKSVNLFLICCVQLILVFSISLTINSTNKYKRLDTNKILYSNKILDYNNTNKILDHNNTNKILDHNNTNRKIETTTNLSSSTNSHNINSHNITKKDTRDKEGLMINMRENIKKDSSYFTREINKNKAEVYYKTLGCFKFISMRNCKKINNFTYKVSAIKKATLWENGFELESELWNKNIINKKNYFSYTDVFKQVPVSIIRGYFMPIMFNSNKLVVILSGIKIIGSIIFLYFFYLAYKNRSIKELQIISGIILIFLPLTSAIDLVTSNYFTYLRYVYPVNVIIILITFSFVINKISKIKND